MDMSVFVKHKLQVLTKCHTVCPVVSLEFWSFKWILYQNHQMNRKHWSFHCSAALTVLNYQLSLLGCSYLIILCFKKKKSIWVVHLWPQVHEPSWSIASSWSLGTLLMFSYNRKLCLVSRGSAVCWRKKTAMMRSGYSHLNVQMPSLRSERVL